MNRTRALGALALAIALGLPTLSGCSGSSQSDSSGSADQATAQGAPPAVSELVPGTANDAGSAADSAKGGSVLDQRAIITTISTTIEVGDVPAATVKVIGATAQAKGYVESQYTASSDPDNPVSTLTVRIPGAAVDRFMSAVGELGTVRSSERSSADVTAEVADVDARLANAEAGVRRLRQLMARAEKISDIVALESALSERQAEAESLAAQKRALANQTSLATITVVLTPTPASPPNGFMGGLQDGWRAFTASVSGLARLAGMLLPFALVAAAFLGLLFLFLRRGGRRSQARGQSGTPAPQPAPEAQLAGAPVAGYPGPAVQAPAADVQGPASPSDPNPGAAPQA